MLAFCKRLFPLGLSLKKLLHKRHYEKFADGTVRDIEDEIPFDVPEGWAWARIASLVSINLGLTHTPKYVEKGIPFYSVKDISNGYLDESEPKYVSQEEFNTFLEGAKPRKGDIIFCRVGTIGKPHIVSVDYPFGIFVSVGFFRKYSERINSKYIMDWMNSPFFYEQVDYNVKGGVIKNLNTGWLSEFLIPIPSEKEQQEIAFRIDEIFSKIALLEENKTELQKTVTYAKAKILDLAIHGKLVPQDTNDEPASVLLEKLRAEKEEKIAKGELKRDKNDSFIYKGSDNCYYEKLNGKEICIDDEIPFEIPEGWIWCRLPSLCEIPITDGTHQTPSYSDKENGVPFLSSKDVTSGKIDWSNIKYITKDLHQLLYKRIAPRKFDILLAKNGTTGVAAMVEDDKIFDIYVTLAVLRPIQKMIIPAFLLNVINSPFCKDQFNEHLTGIGVPNLHLIDINRTIIPIPPLKEQERIVSKIKKLFLQLDQLQMNIV